MTTPKFKIGERVNSKGYNDPFASVGVIRSFRRHVEYGNQYEFCEDPNQWWHESHLSLDVPAPKAYVSNSEVGLGVEILNPDWEIFQLRAALQRIAGYCGGACSATASHKFHLLIADEVEAVIANQKKEIERLTRININLNYQVADQKKEIERMAKIANGYVNDISHLSNRLTEEIGGRHRERAARESSLADVKMLKEDKLVLNDKLMAAANDVYFERTAKEAAQKELAQTKENEIWCCNKLSELANELSAERLAKTSAQKELADLRWALKEIAK